MNPMKNITVNCDSFLIMAIALERLLAVWKPIRYRIGIIRKSRRVHALAFILPPILVSTLINIPKFLETELYLDNITNERGHKEQFWDFRVTDLREDPDYIYYYVHWFRNIITGIIPIIFLIIVNAAIYFFLPSSCNKSNYKYKYTTSISNSASFKSPDSEQPLMDLDRSRSTDDAQYKLDQRNSQLSQDSMKYFFKRRLWSQDSDIDPDQDTMDRRKSTKVLIRQKSFKIVRKQNSHSALTLTFIVIVYIVCNLPRLLLNLFEHLLQDDLEDHLDACGCETEPKWFTILCSISHFLLTFNSSANFVIYWSTVNKFKKTLINLLTCKQHFLPGNS